MTKQNPSETNDPITVAQIILQRFKENLEPKQLQTTFQYIEAIFNDKNQLVSDIFNFLEIAQHEKWKIEIPLWCLCRTINCPKDEIFSKQVYEIHVEIDKAAEKISLDTLGEALDTLLKIQMETKLFNKMDDILQIAFMLNSSFKETMSFISEESFQFPTSFLNEAKFRWLNSLIIQMSDAHQISIPSELQNFLENKNLLSKFLKIDLRMLQNILNNSSESKEILQNFKDLIIDFEEAELNQNKWEEISRFPIKTIGDLHSKIIVKTLFFIEKSQKEYDIFEKLNFIVSTLFYEQNWRLKNFKAILFRCIESDYGILHFIEVLNLCHEYGIESIDGIDNIDLKTLTTVMAQKIFGETSYTLSTTETIEAIQTMNSFDSDECISLCETYIQFQQRFQELTKKLNSLEELKHEIQEYRKFQEASHWLSEKINRIAAAIFSIHKYFNVELRPVQIFAVLIAMKSRDSNFGQLLQVQTGEGKTMIIAAIAISEAINNIKVDIVTSSTELAITQCEKLSSFYQSIGIHIHHNASEEPTKAMSNKAATDLQDRIRKINETGQDPGGIFKETYTADIIYGTVEDFLADILRSEFMDYHVRSDRQFQLVIVDEVDSMLIDGRNDSVRLSSKTPGMNDVLQIYTAIWSQLRNVRSQAKLIDNVWYYISNGEPKPFENNETIQSFSKKACLNFLRQMLRFDEPETEISEDSTEDKIQFPKLEIPKYMQKYIEIQLPKWIDSAISAMFEMKPGFDYVINENQIVAVDAVNTGVHHPTMRWCDGLHQFLQMKHGCYLEPESLATNYMSKVTFFKRYNHNILGLTGTIGGKSSRKFLKKAYNVNFIDIPPFKNRKHHELLPYICGTKDEWINKIAETTASKLKSNRSVLVISNYIKYAEEITEAIKGIVSNEIILYTSNGEKSLTEKEIKPGECIVATNIAGRGTDILVSNESENSGGLHVLLTFLPENDRVERQNIGRTSRTGNPGTSQLIINLSDLSPNISFNFMQGLVKGECPTSRNGIELLRNARDSASMAAVNTEVENIIKRDLIFSKYVKIRKTILQKNSQNKEAAKSSMDTVFAKYLRMVNNHEEESLNKEFEPYVNSCDVLSNPYDAVKAALAILEKTYDNNFFASTELLEKALKMDPNFCTSAFYYLGVIALLEYKNTKEIYLIDEAMENFKKAKDSLELKKLHIQTMIQVTVNDSAYSSGETLTNASLEKSELHSQLERQLTLITALIHNIDTLIGRSISEDLMYLKSALNQKEMSAEERTTLENQKTELENNRNSIEKGFLNSLKSSNSDIEIKSKPLKNILPENERFEIYEKELAQLEDDQFKYIIVLTEKSQINWWAVLTVAGAAVLQLVAGASATVFSLGAGAAVGVAFMQEGISDLIYAVKNGIIERNFDWATYGIQKAISLTITICSFGFGAIKSAAKGVVSGAKAVGKVIMGTANRVTKEGLKLACKAIGKVVTMEVSKITLSSTLNYVCGETLEAGIDGIIQSKINGVLQNLIAGNKHLAKLIKVAQISKSLQYIEIFTKRVMEIIYQSPAFMSELQQITTTLYKKFTKSSNQLLKLGEKFLQNMDIVVIISKLTTILNDLPKFLELIVNENAEKIEQLLEKTDTEVVAMNDTPIITVTEYIRSLSEQISGILSSRIAGFAKQFAVSQVSKYSNWCSSVDGQISKYRETFIDASVVLDAAEKKRNNLKPSSEEHKTINYIEDAAVGGPGDLYQAEYLAKAVEQSIIIHTTNENGEKQVIVIGEEYANKPPIKLNFERPTNGSTIGHYSLTDGTHVTSSGQFNCLYDAISVKTGYEQDLLRKGVANVMLNRLEEVHAEMSHRTFSNLFVGGKEQRLTKDEGPERKRSKSATRHVTRIDNHDQNKEKTDNAFKTRRKKVKTQTNIDFPSDEFDNSVEQNYDPKSKTYTLNQNVVIYENKMNGNVIEETVNFVAHECAFNVDVTETPDGKKKAEAVHFKKVTINNLFPKKKTFDRKNDIKEDYPHNYESLKKSKKENPD